MPAITIMEHDLHPRTNTLHELFTPLRNGKPRVAIGVAKDSPGGMVALVASDGKSSALGYREESFRTSADVLRCRYFELWRGSASNIMTLDRAYFTLMEVVRETREFRDLLCIHTDPADDNDLKRGPHLHLSCAPDPMPHCHIPLAFGFLETVLQDCTSLTKAMERAIQVVAIDVLPKFKNR